MSDSDLFNVHVMLNLGEECTGVAIVVPLFLDPTPEDIEDIDRYMERAKAAALDLLRPFLNHSTFFIAETTIPLWANRGGVDGTR